MSRSLLDQVNVLISQGRQLQNRQSWKEARLCYLSATELMLRVAEDADDKTKSLWLSRAKSLRQAVTRLEDLPSTADGQANRPLEETPAVGAEPWLIAEQPKVTFKDVAGYEAVKREVSLTLLYPFSHREAADYYKIQGGGGIILYGPPGVGKTHFSRAVAGELGLPFFWVKSSDILSKYVGEAEQNIAALFAAARRRQRAVILIDEVEKLMPSRSETVSSVMPRVVGQLLEEMNGFAEQTTMLLLIGNTNVPWLIDEAFLNPRRFGRQIYIPLPDVSAREQILQIHLQQVPYDESIRLMDFAERLEGYSGADIAQICYRARSIPFLEVVHGGEARPLNTQDINRAIAQVEPTVSAAAVRRFEAYAQSRASGPHIVA